MRIIGLHGKKHVGKDAAASFLVSAGYKQISFASPLKEICRILFKFSDEQLYGDKKETIDEYWGVTPRAMFQKIGTDLFRDQLRPDIWIAAADREVKSSNAPIVFADVRFPDEAEYIRSLGGVIVQILRDTGIEDDHVSEKPLPPELIDHTIRNDGTLLDLQYKVTDLVLPKL